MLAGHRHHTVQRPGTGMRDALHLFPCTPQVHCHHVSIPVGHLSCPPTSLLTSAGFSQWEAPQQDGEEDSTSSLSPPHCSDHILPTASQSSVLSLSLLSRRDPLIKISLLQPSGANSASCPASDRPRGRRREGGPAGTLSECLGRR